MHNRTPKSYANLGVETTIDQSLSYGKCPLIWHPLDYQHVLGCGGRLRKETWRERWHSPSGRCHILALFIRTLLDIDQVFQEDERLAHWARLRMRLMPSDPKSGGLGLFAPFSGFLLSKQQQTDGHDEHSDDQPADGKMMFSIFLGRGQEFVQRNVDHDAGDSGEDDPEGCLVEN